MAVVEDENFLHGRLLYGPMQKPSRNRARRAGPVGIVQRFIGENMMQTSAALAFTTLMALVPLVTVVLSLASSLPYLDALVYRLEGLVREALLPPGAAVAITKAIGRFSSNAQKLTLAGLAMLAVTAFMLLHTIERAFNHLWQVKPRPWLARLRLYAFVMAVWPFLLGAVAGVISLAVSVSLGWFDEPEWIRRVVLKAVALGLLGVFFGFLYYAVPNAPVSRRAARLGGAFATLAFPGRQKVFELYLVSSAMVKSIYGAFAFFPIFLIWLHLSWALVMIGGLIVAGYGRSAIR